MGNGNNGGGGGGAMIMLLVLGGVCCMSVVCSGGVLFLYNTNKDFKASIDGLFGGNKDDDGKTPAPGPGVILQDVSTKSGMYVCPDAPSGFDPFPEPVEKDGVYWCQHPKASDTSVKNQLIRNHSRASRLPNPAISGKTYTHKDLELAEAEGGDPGEYGPGKSGFGSDKATGIYRASFKYTA